MSSLFWEASPTGVYVSDSLCVSGGVDVCTSDFLLLIINSFFWELGKWRGVCVCVCVCVCKGHGLLLLRGVVCDCVCPSDGAVAIDM